MNRQDIVFALGEHAGERRQRFGIKELSLFGSTARDEAAEKSDVDPVVEFEGRADFDRFMDLTFYREELLGQQVELVTRKALRPRVAREIERELIHVA